MHSESSPHPQLRDYQQAAVAAVDNCDERALIVAGCGTGKTLIAAHAVTKLLAGQAGMVLMLFPTLGLLEQTYQMWRAESPLTFTALAVCSQDITGEEDIGTKELSVASTTSPSRLAEFLTTAGGTRVVFATYQSLSVITAAHSECDLGPWSVVVCDEAHRTAGRAGKPFGAVLHQRDVPANHRLFLTATPRIHNGPRRSSPRRQQPRSVASMDDPELYGQRVFTLTTRDAINRGILSQFKVAVIAVSDSAVSRVIKDVRQISLEAGKDVLVRADHVAATIALTQAANDYQLSSVLAFHNTIAASQEFAATFRRTHAHLATKQLATANQAASITHIDGKSTLRERLTAIQSLRHHLPGEWNMVTNARAITEGINIPALDAVFFAEPRSSNVDVAQAVGRAIRKNPYHNRPALIILAVTVNDDQDAESVIDISEFQRIRQVLTALQSHDPSIAQDLAQVRTRLAKDRPGGGSVNTDIIDIQLPAQLPAELADKFLRAFSIHTVDTLTGQWEQRFRDLTAYVAENGHAAVPQQHCTPGGHALGQWVSSQRRAYQKGSLPEERIERLQAFPGWAWNKLDASFEAAFAQLADYAREHGHSYPPRRNSDGSTVFLNQWVVGLRRPGNREKLTPERRQRLEGLPGWSWEPRQKSTWEQFYSALLVYIEKHGGANPPEDYCTADGMALGQWVAEMRVPSRQNKLGSDLRERLASLPGWTWEYQFKRSPDRMPRMRLPEWQIGWAALEEYVKETGHAAPPKNFTTTGGVRLGRWALRQRQLYLSGELEREKAEQLWTLPGWVWNVSDAQWERNYAALEAYVLVHGNTYPSSEYETENGQSLASWVATQRKAIKRGTLRQNRRERLEDLPGWDLARPFRARRRTAPISRELPPHYVALWEQGYDELVAYTATHGNPHVPQRYRAETGFTLGHWVSAQRMSYRNGTMKASFPERIQRLESVDGWVWSHFDALWEAGYTQLFEYSRQHETASPGSKFVTDSGYRLGEWVMDQRRKFRSGQLSGQRSERLGALPGWYWEK